MAKNFNEEILRAQYFKFLENPRKISRIRNDLLTNRYVNLPSYCFWTPDDLQIETIRERKKWIKLFDNDISR